jgi:hypothetical protein
MRYLKTYKLFEGYVDDPLFTRFSHNDLLNGEEEAEYQPGERRMVGPDVFNDSLVKLGFPDKKRCVHFMDEIAFNPSGRESYSPSLYGDKIYNVKVDDTSYLGWSFVSPVNEWFYKTRPGWNLFGKIKPLLDPKIFGPREDDQETTDEFVKLLVQEGVIGFGTLSDLMRSKFWGKFPLFAWTNDKVKVSKKTIEPKTTKETKPYRRQTLLTPDDFNNLGVDKSKIGLFYNSEEGKRLNMIDEDLPYEEKEEQALNLLKIWSENL